MRSTFVYALDSLIVLFCIAGFYQVFEKAGLPVAFERSSLIVAKAPPASWLKPGDRLVAIDGTPVATVDEVEFLLDSRPVGSAALLGVDRSGAAVNDNATLVRYFSLPYIVLQLIAIAVFIYLGMFVYVKRKSDRAALMFNLASLSCALIIAATWGRYTIAPIGLGYAVRAAFHLAYAMSGVLFVHFMLVFPAERNGRTRQLLGILYAAAVALAMLSTWFFADAARDLNVERFHLYNTVFNSTRLYFAVCALAGLAVAVHTFITARDESERRKLRWILLGLAAGPLCFVALWVVPQVFTSRGLVDEQFILVAMLAVPATFAISIVRYHVLNIDRIFKRTTIYGIILFAMLALYAAIVGTFSLLIGTVGASTSLAISTIAAAVIAALFQPIRSATQRFVDRKFFLVRYSYREAEKEFIGQILFCYDDDSIRRTVTAAVDRLLPNADTRLWLLNQKAPQPPEAMISYFQGKSTPLALASHVEPGAAHIDAGQLLFASPGIAIAFRIHSEQNGLLGCLLLGAKRSGFPFTPEDIDLLETFCKQTALALDRVHLQRSLIAEQLETARLKELNELKSFFVSSVTHELKTPLTSIRMFTELLETSQRLRKMKRDEYVRIIKSESERLSRLIDNVLNLSKIEKGKKEYRFAPVELNACVDEAVKSMQFQFELQDFTVRVRCARRKLTICADRDAVIEVLLNLFSNAVKYASQKREITVSTRATPSGAQLRVEDCGIGIAHEDIGRIFEPFERTQAGRLTQTSGTGLGLALVKHIADAHKAALEVESEPGKGSAFSVTFPYTTTEHAA